ncbi:MAG: TauD/TfdA family dioxygenase [Acidimicrobiia bacterium]|nr:TauD/TfdA family dioxygenase [Acidimicrobiia bacterium]MDH5519042.1 TauD/TfdA family dioxygenase [Acidimicrobiia bacterium]
MTFSITVTGNGLDLHLPGFDQSAPISWHWLRDHDESEAGQDPDTKQRRVDTFSLGDVEPGTVTVDDGWVTVTWPDATVAMCSRQLLESVAEEFLATDWSARPELKPILPTDIVLWSDPTTRPDEIDLGAFLDPASDEALTLGVDLLSRYGYLVLRGDVLDRGTAEAFARRLGYIRHTIFGGLWDLAPDLSEHADTAYTSVHLAPHTDGTYSHDAPGLQFFLCLAAAPEGGESLLVDGFAIAAELETAEPETFVTLASVPVPGRYIEPGVHLRAERPVFRSNARGVLDQVSFNNYDRAPFLLPPEQELRFHRAYRRFAELAAAPARRVAVGLTPGDILIFDNWRSLHGRNAFVGPRHYVGAYLNHEDLESKRRVLLGS